MLKALALLTLSWTAPTHNTDGSELTDLAGFNIYWGDSCGNYTQNANVPDPAATEYVVELEPGTYCFVATAYNEPGLESDYSEPITKLVMEEIVTPLPPQVTQAAVDTVVYAISESRDSLVLYPVGVVRQDVACDASQTVMGYQRVPIDAVRFAPGAASRTVYAACSGN